MMLLMLHFRQGWYVFVKVPEVVRIYWYTQDGMSLL